jgi:hypothetical protein
VDRHHHHRTDGPLDDIAGPTEVDEVIAEARRLLSGRTFDAQRGCRRRR